MHVIFIELILDSLAQKRKIKVTGRRGDEAEFMTGIVIRKKNLCNAIYKAVLEFDCLAMGILST